MVLALGDKVQLIMKLPNNPPCAGIRYCPSLARIATPFVDMWTTCNKGMFPMGIRRSGAPVPWDVLHVCYMFLTVCLF